MMDEYEDLFTYNGVAEHDLWVDYDYQQNTGELDEWSDEEDLFSSDNLNND